MGSTDRLNTNGYMTNNNNRVGSQPMMFSERPDRSGTNPLSAQNHRRGQIQSQEKFHNYKDPQSKPELVSNEIYVTKWVDYSSKYGLGYLLSNKCTGVFFNDSTKIVIDNIYNGDSNQKLYYFERKAVN